MYWALVKLGPALNVTLVPPPSPAETAAWGLPEFLPAFAQNWQWWQNVFAHVVTLLPVMLPFALATVVGGIDCTESAAAAGDEFDTRSILWTEGIASILAGLAGGVIQTTPYIGQPAYKTMGGRAAYTLATAIFIGLAGALGWISQLFVWIPQAACFPILVFVGLEIGASRSAPLPRGTTRPWPWRSFRRWPTWRRSRWKWRWDLVGSRFLTWRTKCSLCGAWRTASLSRAFFGRRACRRSWTGTCTAQRCSWSWRRHVA